eukprot:tig00020675_g12621.t1
MVKLGRDPHSWANFEEVRPGGFNVRSAHLSRGVTDASLSCRPSRRPAAFLTYRAPPGRPSGRGVKGRGSSARRRPSIRRAASVRTRHLHINLALLFHEKVARGHVDVHATVLRDGVKVSGSRARRSLSPGSNVSNPTGLPAQEMVLDGKAVAIEYVEVLTLEPENHAVTHKEQVLWTIPRHHPVGFALHIPIPESMQKAGSQPVFRVHYRTTEYSGGIQWLDAKQTAGKKHPFAFTQFECILARTVVPCQDTPSVKATYSIEVRCPTPLVAVCSGENECAPVFHPQDNTISYSYRQRNPIPSYLIALACGALANAPIGPRSRIYAEQCMLDASVHEFRAETEAFIKAAEKVTGVPYNWGRYDIVVLPSSFPYGGMENPNLNFLSASLLAGDRSLTNVLAHEIAHSWSGNLVTNENWSSFWLNEGFTWAPTPAPLPEPAPLTLALTSAPTRRDYIERLILSTVHNSPALRDFEMISGYLDLVKARPGRPRAGPSASTDPASPASGREPLRLPTVKDFEEEGNMEYTKLMPDLEPCLARPPLAYPSYDYLPYPCLPQLL